MIKVICWNVNSIRSRMPILQQLIEEHSPDVVLLQETKCTDDKFPHLELDSYGYNIATFGQKTFNGVTIMSKAPITDIRKGLPDFEDEQARYIECVTTLNGTSFRFASVYVPNGAEVESNKFVYKLAFMEALKKHLLNLKNYEEAIIIGGDFNVAPEETDVYNPKYLDGSIGFNINERKIFRSIINNGYYDSFRCKHPTIVEFSWWDYRAGSFANNSGMRIDHILTSPEATDMIHQASIIKQYRKLNKTSDHAPILCEFNNFSKS